MTKCKLLDDYYTHVTDLRTQCGRKELYLNPSIKALHIEPVMDMLGYHELSRNDTMINYLDNLSFVEFKTGNWHYYDSGNEEQSLSDKYMDFYGLKMFDANTDIMFANSKVFKKYAITKQKLSQDTKACQSCQKGLSCPLTGNDIYFVIEEFTPEFMDEYAQYYFKSILMGFFYDQGTILSIIDYDSFNKDLGVSCITAFINED